MCGGHKTAGMRHARRTRRGYGVRGGTGQKEVDGGMSSERLQSFQYQDRPVIITAQDAEDESCKTSVKQGAGFVTTNWTASDREPGLHYGTQ